MKIIDYNNGTITEVQTLFENTFSDSEGQSEGEIISNLVADILSNSDQNEIYCFGVEEQKKIIACVIFSRLRFDENIKAAILSPMAVATDHQKQGIGQQLINHGLDRLKAQGIELVMTYGDINFYAKVGFQQVSTEQIPPPQKLSYPHGWLAQSLTASPLPKLNSKPNSVIALENPVYW